MLAFTAALAQAARPGDPDPRFNDGAPVLVDCARSSVISHCAFHALAADTNGGLLVAGEGSDEDGRIGLALARLHDDGTLDTSFGTGGSLVMQLGLGSTAFAPFSRGAAIGSRPDDAGWIVLGSASYARLPTVIVTVDPCCAFVPPPGDCASTRS